MADENAVTDQDLIARLEGTGAAPAATATTPPPAGGTGAAVQDPDLIARLSGNGPSQSDAPWDMGTSTASAVLLGQGARVRAAGNAVKEAVNAMRAGTPLSELPANLQFYYNQALSTYQGAHAQYAKDNPGKEVVANVTGTLPTLALGGGLVNAGLRTAGTAIPALASTARFALGGAGVGEAGLTGLATRAASRTALMAREGAQTGVATSGMDDNTVGENAQTGGEIGAAAGAATAPVAATIAGASRLPAKMLKLLPKGVGTGAGMAAGALGTHGLWENMAELGPMILHNPSGAAAALGVGSVAALSRLIDSNPTIRQYLTRLGTITGTTAGTGAATQGQSTTDPAAPGAFGPNGLLVPSLKRYPFHVDATKTDPTGGSTYDQS